MRFHGAVGYGDTVETTPGVWEDVITEKSYYGDVENNALRAAQGNEVAETITLSNSISVVADAYANENFSNIRYVVWNGVRWTVNTVTIDRPRLILYLGEVYNGPIPV
jgi:hypothetical protein